MHASAGRSDVRYGRGKRGFTLAELVIVTLIISIMAAVTVPKYAAALDDYRTHAAAQRVAADLSLARVHAKATSDTQTVQFTTSSDSYVLAGMADPDRSANTYVVDLLSTAYPASLFSVNFGGGDTVTFNQYGQPDNGGSIVLKSGNSVRTVTVDANTGKATLD